MYIWFIYLNVIMFISIKRSPLSSYGDGKAASQRKAANRFLVTAIAVTSLESKKKRTSSNDDCRAVSVKESIAFSVPRNTVVKAVIGGCCPLRYVNGGEDTIFIVFTQKKKLFLSVSIMCKLPPNFKVDSLVLQ